jgi:hypothetical protein
MHWAAGSGCRPTVAPKQDEVTRGRVPMRRRDVTCQDLCRGAEHFAAPYAKRCPAQECRDSNNAAVGGWITVRSDVSCPGGIEGPSDLVELWDRWKVLSTAAEQHSPESDPRRMISRGLSPQRLLPADQRLRSLAANTRGAMTIRTPVREALHPAAIVTCLATFADGPPLLDMVFPVKTFWVEVPWEFVTVRVTVKVPAVAYVWVILGCVVFAACPSPNFQA